MADVEKEWVCDMLEGAINRMCVTNSEGELLKMYGHAGMYLDGLYDLMQKRLDQKKKEVET